MEQNQDPLQPFPLTGVWHLVSEDADEARLPEHRMDVVIRQDGAMLSAAIVSRVTGREVQLIERITFEGDVLRLQLKPQEGTASGPRPVLVMVPDGGKFVGGWMHETTPLGPPLKLVRHATPALA